MGKVTIVSGGEDGLYTATPNFDITAATNELEKLNDRLTNLQIDIRPSAILKQSSARAALDSAIAATNAAIVDYQGEPSSDNEKALKAATAAEIAARTAHSIAVGELNRTDIEIASVNARINQIHALTADANNPVQVWCADVTENLTGEVAAIEINSDQRDGILIRPGHEDGSADYTPARDGIVTLPVAMSPSSTFFNWALKPCIQRTRPVYRSATILSIEDSSNTCSIRLHESQSMDAEHVINDSSVMFGVPISYMTCNAAAFNVGDEVVVEFANFDETQPTVIGFVSNPKRCHIIVGGTAISSLGRSGIAVRWDKPDNPVSISIELEGGNYQIANAISGDRSTIVGRVEYHDGITFIGANGLIWTDENGATLLNEDLQIIDVTDVSFDGSVLVGYAVGYSAFRLNIDGSFELLEIPSGYLQSVATRVSDDGLTVLGWVAEEDDDIQRSVLWTPSGVVFLPIDGYGLSGDGSIVVGRFVDVSGRRYACKWTQSGGTVLLNELPGWHWSYATAISSDGSTIVGYGQALGSPADGVIWTEASGATRIDAPPGVSVFPTAVSANGKAICGSYRNPYDPFLLYDDPEFWGHGFYWTKNSGLVTLNPPSGLLLGYPTDIV